MKLRINTIYNENCVDTMRRMPNECIDLTVTSPPYGRMRDYEGFEFCFDEVALELFRVTKEGGVVVWVEGDQTINYSESGLSFRHALAFMEIGFGLHDTMIYSKSAISHAETKRYHPAFEYTLALSKGRPKTFNGIKDRVSLGGPDKNLCVGEKLKARIGEPGTGKKPGLRYNLWTYHTASGIQRRDKWHNMHPAPFPEKLAADHIYTWSNEKDLVYDPMAGGGTALKMAIRLGRDYIGSEISEKYVNEIIKPRIKEELKQPGLAYE